tara:strand:+ start:2930 stop:4516 length:1587 start_codon:yes stop_codon:yes gene_type:complete
MDMTRVLTEVELAGIKVDTKALAELKKDYNSRIEELLEFLTTSVKEAMGDTPINLDSPEDRSLLFYSRKVNNKKEWASLFNIGTTVNERGSRRQKRRTEFNRKDFRVAYQANTAQVYKTTASQCPICKGFGKTSRAKKDGTYTEARYICKRCEGLGIIYTNNLDVAGFSVKPITALDCTAHGFKTDSTTLQNSLTSDISEPAKEFIRAYCEYSSIKTYLRTFVEGIEKALTKKEFIHPNFMQCVTATGRLSSRSPNFQNMPRANTFPVRKTIVSRWENGFILEGDYKQLEFRVAGFLAEDSTVYKEVEEGFDVHSFTAEMMGVSRQEAKAHTFKPLYGGVSGTDKQKEYYRAFKNKYTGITHWHELLAEEAISRKRITLPSGREYLFPNVRRTRWGGVTSGTSVKNYPVQGFATADLLPIALVHTNRLLAKRKMKSVICNTVHDSIVLDVCQEEKDLAVDILSKGMLSLFDECKKRYNIIYSMPIGIELKIGKNWLDLEPILELEWTTTNSEDYSYERTDNSPEPRFL